MTWALTPWGLVCQEIADFVTDLTAGYPQFSVGIGPDPDDLAERGPRITFLALDSEFEDPRYGGGLQSRGTFDEVIPVRVSIHVPTDIDTATNYDRSPLLLHAVVSRFLEACDAVRHTPYSRPRSHGRRGGRTGEHGSTSIIVLAVRIEYGRTPYTLGTATLTSSTFGVAGPDGNGGTVIDSFTVVTDG